MGVVNFKITTSAMSCSIWIIRSAVVESKPDVGSSRKRSEGLRRTSLPIHTLFFSPPDTPLTNFPPTIVFWHLKSWVEWINIYLETLTNHKKKGTHTHTLHLSRPSCESTSMALSIFCCLDNVLGRRSNAE